MKSLQNKKYLITIVIFLSTMVSLNSFTQVVINEVMTRPSGAQGLINFNGAMGKEYIELYNTGCSPVDVSGYFLAMRQDFAGNASGGAFRIPTTTSSVIPPNGHLVLGTSASSIDINSVDIIIPNYVSNYCQNSSVNLILANADGWLGLYDLTGTPIDAIFWSSSAANISQVGDYAGVPCVPSGSTVGITLESAQQINAGFLGVLNYVGNTTSTDLTFSRISDGGTWGRDIAPTINDLSGGNCNGGTCITTASFVIPAIVSQPTCSTTGSIAINPSPSGTYTYSWSHDGSLTLNTATGLTAGSYTISVSLGGCQKDTSILLSNGSGPTSILINPTNETCSLANGQIQLGAVSGGTSPYQYNFNGLGLSSNLNYNNLTAGTYTLIIQDVNGCIYNAQNTVLTNNTNGCCLVPLTFTKDSIPNTVCNGTNNPCSYSGPTILINEIGIYPTINDGSIFGDGPSGPGSGEGEWIELFNPDWCNSIDISGYILGSYNSTSSGTLLASNGMSFSLPANTIVPPLGFVLIRGANTSPPPLGVIDIVVNNSNNEICIDGGLNSSRIWFQNAGGWFAFYDRNGVAQDVIQWGSPLSNDLNGNPCIPLTNSLPVGFTQIPSNTQTGISYNLGNPASGQTFVRIPDGGNWSSTLAAEITSYGSCNVIGGCVNSGGASSSCNGTATVTMTSGQAPYTYLWDDVLAQTTSTADSLCAGIYNLSVTDAQGCIKLITVEIIDELLNIAVTGTNPSCGNLDGIMNVVANPIGAYNYTWSANTGIVDTLTTNVNNLNGGTYTVTVSSPTCTKDTTITLTSYPAITNLASVSVNEICNKADGQITLGQVTGGTATFQYNFNNGGNGSTTQFSNLASGTYPVTVTDIHNCSYSTQINIGETQGPTKIDFQTINSGCSSNTGLIEVTNVTGGQTPYSYNLSSSGYSSSSLFEELGGGFYTLSVKDMSNCLIDTLIQLTTLSGGKDISVPNVFTPNGDNSNDLWFIKGDCLEAISCNIFNRWGNLIKSYDDINGNWNGKTDEDIVTDGVYFYKLKVTFSDGEIKDYQGNITVIY